LPSSISHLKDENLKLVWSKWTQYFRTSEIRYQARRSYEGFAVYFEQTCVCQGLISTVITLSCHHNMTWVFFLRLWLRELLSLQFKYDVPDLNKGLSNQYTSHIKSTLKGLT